MASDISPERQKSMDAAYWNGTVWALMNGFGNPYVAAFAVFLGASSAEVGWLTAIPAGVAALACLASSWLVQRLGKRKPLVFAAMVGQALMWVLLLAIPFVLPSSMWVFAVIGVWCLVNIFVYLPSTAWDSMLGDVVPTRLRSAYFSRRSQSINAVSLLATLCAGFVIGFFASGSMIGGIGGAAIGFAICFALAALGRFVSALFVGSVTDYPYKHEEIIVSPKKIWEGIGKNEFVNIVFFIAIASFAGAIAMPLFAAYLLKDLHVSPVVFGLLVMAPMMATVVLLPYWGHISDRFGRKKMLWVSTALLPLVPIAWIFFHEPWQLMVIQFFWGFLQAGFNLNALNFVLDASPSNGRATYLGFYNFLAQGGLFVGGLLGGLLAGTFETFSFGGFSGLRLVFLVSALAGLLPLWWLSRVDQTRYKTEDVYLLWNTGFVLPSLSLLQEISKTPRHLDQFTTLSLTHLSRVPSEGIRLSKRTVQLVLKTEKALQTELGIASGFTLSELHVLLGGGIILSKKTILLLEKTVKAVEQELGPKEELLNQKNTTNTQEFPLEMPADKKG
ncbi:MAG: MFS transporter [Candidatus Diapherotrites archaeon]|nr:MFS transporter [Candidatus Diapherotrites archaeon]